MTVLVATGLPPVSAEELKLRETLQAQDRIYSVAFIPDGDTLAIPAGKSVTLWTLRKSAKE